MPVKVRFAALVIAGICLSLAAPAFAQDTSAYEDIKIGIGEDVVPMTVGLSLMRDPALPPDNFILHVSAADRYATGCPPLKDIGYETAFKNKKLEIKLTGLTVDQSEFPYYKCNGKARNPQADIVLSKDDLMEKNVEKIDLIKGGVRKTYLIELGDERVELMTDDEDPSSATTSMRGQKIDGVKMPMKLWFYPENTLMLYVPGGRDGEQKQIVDKIREMAAAEGLIPLEDSYSDFQPPQIRGGYYYYIDRNGRFKDAAVDGGPIGHISMDRVAYGLQGDEPVSEQVQVFAKRPGAYD